MSPRRVVPTDEQARFVLADAARTAYTGASARETLANRRSIRSADLVEAVRRLDTTTNPQAFQRIMQWIRSEYESRRGGTLVGILGRCHLGAPYVDHRIDLTGSSIIEHYERSTEPPPPFRLARPLAQNDAYAYIEVYEDGMVVPVRANGQPVM